MAPAVAAGTSVVACASRSGCLICRSVPKREIGALSREIDTALVAEDEDGGADIARPTAAQATAASRADKRICPRKAANRALIFQRPARFPKLGLLDRPMALDLPSMTRRAEDKTVLQKRQLGVLKIH